MISLSRCDHHATIDERERYLAEVKSSLPEYYVLLHTCDRVELYSEDRSLPLDENRIREISLHLFRVASGLESPLVGENQIFHQMKSAYQLSLSRAQATAGLHLLFQTASRVGKRVRSETAIGKGAVSHAQGALDILRDRFGDLSGKRIALIGVNNLNRTILDYLRRRSSALVFLGNRTFEKARVLADEFGCEAFTFSSLRLVLAESDILISATSAPHLVVHCEDVDASAELFIIDLAVPRDVDPRLASLEKVTLLNVSDIEAHCAAKREERKEAVGDAEKIIAEEVERFVSDYLRRYADARVAGALS